MKVHTIKKFCAAICAVFALIAAAQADTSSKTVFLKVAYPAGGPTDAYARRLQSGLQSELKQLVIVENLPGAGGAIAAQAVGRLASDGYNLLATSGSDFILTPLTNAVVRYKPEDFRFVGQFFSADWVLAVRPDMPVKNVDEFVEYARKSAKPLFFASWGYGSSPHLLGQEFARIAKISVLDVPYKGVAPIAVDLVSGQVDATFYPFYGATIGLIETGKIKAIGIASNKPNPNISGTGTLNDGKYVKGFVSSGWSGMFARRDTPEDVVRKLNEAINTVVRTPDYQQYLKDTGAAAFSPLSL